MSTTFISNLSLRRYILARQYDNFNDMNVATAVKSLAKMAKVRR
jgi:hypothetical protein